MSSKTKSSRGSWKKERASVTRKGKARPRSNKYRPSADSSERPAPGTRTRYWRGGYTKKDGTRVRGHYVNNHLLQGKVKPLPNSEHWFIFNLLFQSGGILARLSLLSAGKELGLSFWPDLYLQPR